MAGGKTAAQILIGLITGPHGVRGAFKVRSFAARPEDILAYGPLSLADGRQLSLRLAGRQKDLLICQAEGITDRDQASLLQRAQLFVARAALPDLADDEIYQTDLIDCLVIDQTGRPVGKIAGFHDFGAGPLVEVQPDSGQTLFLPFGPAVIRKIDPQQGEVSLEIAPGLLELQPASKRPGSKKPGTDPKGH